MTLRRGLSFLAARRPRFPLSGTLPCLLPLCLAVAGVPAPAADSQRGAGLYATHCALCHGERGAPTWPGAPDLRRMATLMKTDAQVLTTLRYGRGAMPAYVGVLKDRELMDLTAHLRTLAR